MSEDLIDMALGRRLRHRRRLLDLTQRDVALGTGVTFRQIHKYESGANRMSAAMLWRFANFLGVEVGYFYEGLEPEGEAARPFEAEAA